MIILACYNIKGGVGKTSTAVNLAYLAATQGERTLLWDLDPQGAASFYYRIKPRIKGGVNKLMAKKSELDDYIKGSDYDNLDVIPADFSYRNMDLLLDETGKPKKKLRKLLKSLEDEYDYIFLDCPPSVSLMTEAVFYASDIVLVPTIPTVLSLRTLEQVIGFCAEHDFRQPQLMSFFSMADRRKSMHRLILENPPQLNIDMLHSDVPYASEVERMGVSRQPLFCYAAGSRAAQAYLHLWNEIQERIE